MPIRLISMVSIDRWSDLAVTDAFDTVGGAIERWEDDNFRSCFDDLLGGDWKKHDPYDLRGRLNAKTSLYGRPNQVSGVCHNVIMHVYGGSYA